MNTDKLTAEEILKKHIPADCIWEEMNNLTNCPIEYVFAAMEAYKNQSAVSDEDGDKESVEIWRNRANYLDKELGKLRNALQEKCDIIAEMGKQNCKLSQVSSESNVGATETYLPQRRKCVA